MAEIATTATAAISGSSYSSYATARGTANGHSATSLLVGQYYVFGEYKVGRVFLKFDTSSLSGETITSVKLKLECSNDSSTSSDFDVQIVKCDWSSQDPIGSGNRDAAYDLALSSSLDDNIWRNTSGMSTDTPYESGELDTTWVNTSGYTYYALRSSRDASATAPGVFQNEYILINPFYPYLVVTYEGEGEGGSSTPIHLIRTGMQPGMRIGL